MKHQFESINVGKGNIVAVERTSEFAAYLAMINNFQPLTEEEEVELAEKIQQGDKAAKDKLVNANLRFVVSVAKQYAYCGGCLTLMDIINEGNIGLIKAAETFDPTLGFKFTSYAVGIIRGCITNALTNNSRMVHDYHRTTANSHTSLDAPMSDDNDTPLLDTLCQSTDKESTESLETDILRVLNSLLKEREITIVCRFYGIGTRAMAEWEIGENFGLTRERVRQMRQIALSKLRESENAIRLLSKYL